MKFHMSQFFYFALLLLLLLLLDAWIQAIQISCYFYIYNAISYVHSFYCSSTVQLKISRTALFILSRRLQYVSLNVPVALLIINHWFILKLLLVYVFNVHNFSCVRQTTYNFEVSITVCIFYFPLVSVYTGAKEFLQITEHSALRIFFSAKLAL